MKGIEVYPNPVRDQVNVKIEELTSEPSRDDINIIDRIGRSYPVNMNWRAVDKVIEIDFTPMNSGIYLIRVRTDKGNTTVRVVKETE